jgi:hypothetical protein
MPTVDLPENTSQLPRINILTLKWSTLWCIILNVGYYPAKTIKGQAY